MTETDYEHECMRAELLGIEKPSREEFFTRKIENHGGSDEEENWSSDVIQDLDHQGEGLHRASGGLDELNSILSVTQKKINHLKTVCGSFTRILKLHSGLNEENVGPRSSNSSSAGTNNVSDNLNTNEDGQGQGDQRLEAVTPNKRPAGSDIQSSVGSQLSKLDSLISKAEKADLSLSSQNKQMKKFLK